MVRKIKNKKDKEFNPDDISNLSDRESTELLYKYDKFPVFIKINFCKITSIKDMSRFTQKRYVDEREVYLNLAGHEMLKFLPKYDFDTNRIGHVRSMQSIYYPKGFRTDLLKESGKKFRSLMSEELNNEIIEILGNDESEVDIICGLLSSTDTLIDVMMPELERAVQSARIVLRNSSLGRNDLTALQGIINVYYHESKFNVNLPEMFNILNDYGTSSLQRSMSSSDVFNNWNNTYKKKALKFMLTLNALNINESIMDSFTKEDLIDYMNKYSTKD